MQYFWAVIVSVIVLLILYAVVNSMIQKRKPVSIGKIRLKRIDEVLVPERRYHIVLNSGTKFDQMKIVGFTDATGGSDPQISWASRRWLILEDPKGFKTLVSPFRIMWIKETEQRAVVGD